MRNTEIKATVKDMEALEARVKAESAAVFEGVLRQRDTFFGAARGRLKLREQAKSRNAGPSDASAPFTEFTLVYYERPDTEGPKVSSYELVPLATADIAASLVRSLGAANGVLGTVQKFRTLYILDERVRVHLDRVDGLGSFMELEVVLRDDESAEDGAKVAADVMRRIGVADGDLITGAYFDQVVRQK